MNESTLEIAPPRRAFLFIFLITGVVLFLNGLAVLFFAPIPRSAGAIQPSFGVGGWMPIVAGLLCFAGVGWMLNRHRNVSRIAELVQADLPEDGINPESRETLLTALLERAERLSTALETFPEALVTIGLEIGSDHHLELEYLDRQTISGRLATTDDRLAKQIENKWECITLDTEVLIDLGTSDRVSDFIEVLTTDLLSLPPDFELTGNIRVSKRAHRGQQ